MIKEMTNQELVELIVSIKGRFEKLMVDIRNAARIGAFDASAEQLFIGMAGLQVFQTFMQSLVRTVKRTSELGEKIINDGNSDWEEEATKCLRERDYSITKVKNEVDEKKELDDKQKNRVRNKVYFALKDAKYLLDAAVFAGAFENKAQFDTFIRRHVLEMAQRVLERYNSYYSKPGTLDCEENKRAAISFLRNELNKEI